jgi:hypothetical protein
VNPVLSAAAEIESVCAELDLRHCFIGGLAVLRWGEPRLTRDVDLTVLALFGEEETVVDALLGRFPSRVDDARDFALRHRTLLLRASNGIPLDVALGALPFEERSTERASPWPITDEVNLRVCSAEDLVVHKVFAGRDRDWLDVEGIAVRQGRALDARLIARELHPLLRLKGTATRDIARLDALLRRAG